MAQESYRATTSAKQHGDSSAPFSHPHGNTLSVLGVASSFLSRPQPGRESLGSGPGPEWDWVTALRVRTCCPGPGALTRTLCALPSADPWPRACWVGASLT